MGCCQSTATPPNGPTKECEDRRAPPSPPPPEEESVKEVLSETPISKPPTPSINTNTNRDYPPPLVQQQALKNTEPPPLYLRKAAEKEEAVLVSEISEASEMCSFSGSFSTNNLNNDKLDDADEVTQRVVGTTHHGPRPPRKRSYSGEFNGPGKDRVLRSPARRSTPSPGKRNQMRSTATNRQAAAAAATQGRTAEAQRRSAGPTTSKDGAQRRSRSPAPRGEMSGGGHVGPNKQTVSRVTGNLGGRSPEREVADGEKVEEQRDEGVSGGDISESLENPHVSLECFIFL